MTRESMKPAQKMLIIINRIFLYIVERDESFPTHHSVKLLDNYSVPSVFARAGAPWGKKRFLVES